MDVISFFKQSAGRWRSQRTTHHLPFKQTEIGNSEIWVEALAAADPKIVEICQIHQVDPILAVGGAFVEWSGSLSWDQSEDDNHSGSTVFALVPDADDPQRGQLLRERGYAEVMPVIGRYQIDDDNGLVLTTDYETMSSVERFWFVNPDLRCRSSTVKRFGGFSTASFCTESRLAGTATSEVEPPALGQIPPTTEWFHGVFGG
ncbi:phycobiliprotein lyase [Synechococcales cyanobacterium C]|uniref:Chromophore lyase CpcS/CpeS n=1 Tax=Petrachloros mirabilis ULC683 TaxID=2781853 RepID=A0A8K2A902_9CYAN|nr:phycobiliprotein lyase [Petrachloros mirabilis]NCJ07734.1 phycobiliprotein lyase [Petrachloros mirabilis ULC683]